MGSCDWRSLAAEVEGRLRSLSEDVARRLEPVLEELRRCFVLERFGGEVEEARRWIAELERAVEGVKAVLGVEGVLFPKELRSFLRDPLAHLVKKLFNYAYDLARGRIGVAEFEKVGEAAVRTSLRTNLRSVYEAWVYLTLLKRVGDHGGELVFPEHPHVLFERSGRQRGGGIPPNAVLRLGGRGYLSFFVEAPRPIGWADTGDLSRSWRLYVALRPDLMVYGGLVMDIVRDGDPPVERPDVIVECKELADWFVRVREVRGPLAREMTAEEWRSRWIRGLWAGLADVLGVSTPEEAYEHARRRRGVRLREPQIVRLYARVYRPRTMYLVSRAHVPREVRSELEADGVVVVDSVGFNPSRLEPVVEGVVGVAGYRGAGAEVVRLPAQTAARLEEAALKLGVSVADLVEALVELGARRVEELRALLEARASRKRLEERS
jgi:hypothetical protein